MQKINIKINAEGLMPILIPNLIQELMQQTNVR